MLKENITILSKYKSVYTLLIAFCASYTLSYLLYSLFYYFSPYFWTLNLDVKTEDLAPIVRSYLEKDGAEVYVIFFVVSIYLLLTYLISSFIVKIQSIYIFALLAVISCAFLYKIGFHFPMPPENTNNFKDFLLALFSFISLPFFIKFLQYRSYLQYGFVFIFCFISCLISTGHISHFDYDFVVSPALRLYHGYNLSEIYFQYDLFLTSFPYLLILLDIDLSYLMLICQISFFIFYIVLFLFARQFFKDSNLPYYFLICEISIRIYALFCDHATIFQISPLRLDIWILLVLLAHKKGVFHYSMGLLLGLLLIVHKSFGTIYTAVYLETLLFLFIIDVFSDKEQPNFLTSIKKQFYIYFQKTYFNIVIIAVFYLISLFMFGSDSASATSLYRSIGIGFSKISELSFYWHIFAFKGFFFFVLLYYKGKLDPKYFQICILILFLAIGNSFYFYGRSHENNLINISSIFLLLPFIALDIINSNNTILKMGKIYHYLPALFFAVIIYGYYHRIQQIAEIKLHHLKHGRFYALEKKHFEYAIGNEKNVIIKYTKNSKKVYFITLADGYYYYTLGIKPEGFFQPSSIFIYKKDMVSFLGKLLKENYMLVITIQGEYDQIIDTIAKNNNLKIQRDTISDNTNPQSSLSVIYLQGEALQINTIKY